MTLKGLTSLSVMRLTFLILNQLLLHLTCTAESEYSMVFQILRFSNTTWLAEKNMQTTLSRCPKSHTCVIQDVLYL